MYNTRKQRETRMSTVHRVIITNQRRRLPCHL